MTKRPFLFGLLLLLSPFFAHAQQPGDLALIGLNADNPDAFGFVVLAPLSAGTTLHFTDNGWQDTGQFRANEGTFTYTVPAAGLQPGTVVRIDAPAGPAFSTSGDQLLVYSGADNSPAFVYALNVEGSAEWQTTASSSNTSALPPGLVNGSTAVAVDEFDNVAYSGPTTGTKAELLAAIGQPGNWTGDDATRLDFTASFTVVGDGGNSAPFFTAVLTDTAVPAGATFSFTYAATDNDGDALSYTFLQVPTGATVGADSGTLTWTPTTSDIGMTFVVEVAVSDGQATQTTSATLTVEDPNVNQPPFLPEAANGLMVAADAPVQFFSAAQDPNGDVLTYTLLDGPPEATVDSVTGELSWPGASEAGLYTFVMRASDGSASADYRLYVGVRGVLFAGMEGQALRDALESTYAPAQTLGYDRGRDTLYAVVEARQGVVSGIYTGYAVTLDPNDDPSSFLFNNNINAEHTWPQSMGAADEPQRSDMHILYPANASVNSARGNLPYAEIDDEAATAWYYLDQTRTTPPDTDRDAWSERTATHFEPREAVKGDVARAIFYFATIWDEAANQAFFDGQVATLAQWDTADPGTDDEARRSGLIATYQGNINPYILDATLASRVFLGGTGVGTEEMPTAAFSLSAPYPNPARGTAQFTLTVAETQPVRVALYDVLGREVATLADGVVVAGTVLPIRIEGAGLPAGVYFYRAQAGAFSAVRQVVIGR